MKIEHRLRAHGRCPVDGALDAYQVIVRCHRVIKVEDILAAVESFTTEPVLQEQFTRQLAARLRAEVETIGFHSGVETRVVA